MAFIPVTGGCIGIFEALLRHVSFLDSRITQASLLVIFQWLMILPHELGHAIAGRALGFTQIRILVGTGRELFSFQLFGFPTLVNLIPFGGVTLSNPAPKSSRGGYLAFLGSGLVINFVAGAIAWYIAAPGELFRLDTGRVVTPFFWANVLLLVENLFPYQAHTPYGLLNSDGLQLWNVLFRWNKPMELESVRVARWEIVVRQQLKWTIFAVMAGATMFFLSIGVLPFLGGGNMAGGFGIKIVLPAVMAVLALVSGWAAVRIVKEPIPIFTKSAFAGNFPQPLSITPERERLLKQALECGQRNDFAAGEALLDQVLSGMPDNRTSGYWAVAQLKMEQIISQDQIERAEKVCLDWVNQAATVEDKVRILDGFASQILYKSKSSFLPNAERLVRQALVLSPASLTLKGTLGGILVEQGRFAEAEQFLLQCLDGSPALHDQGISAFYLGVAKLSTGDRSEARRLIRRGMVLHTEPWLLAKAKDRLKKLNQ